MTWVWMRRALSCSPFVEVNTTLWPPVAGFVAQPATKPEIATISAAHAATRRPAGRPRRGPAAGTARRGASEVLRTICATPWGRGPGTGDRALIATIARWDKKFRLPRCRNRERCGKRPLACRSPADCAGRSRAGTAGAGGPGSRALLARRRCVLLAELVHAPGGIDDLLLARVERMAVRADFDLQIVAQRRAGLEGVTAGADHRDLFVLGMNGVFHGML